MFFNVGSYFIMGGIFINFISTFFTYKLQNYLEISNHSLLNNFNIPRPWSSVNKFYKIIKKNPHEFEDKKIVAHVKKIIITRRLAQVIFLAGCLMIIIHLILLP